MPVGPLQRWRRHAARWGSDRLAIRQVAYALGIGLALGAVFSLLHLAQDYRHERQRIAAASRGVLALVRPPAARAAFTLDPELGATVMRTVLEVPFVVRAELQDNHGRPLARASREPDRRRLRWLTDWLFGKQRSYRESFAADGTTLPEAEIAARSVGTLDIEFDTRIMGQDFLSRAWFLLVTGIARTLVLAIVLAVVTHLMITRPLARLVAAVERVDPDAPDRLPIQVSPSHARDELGRLGGALDALLTRFAHALAQQREAFDHLATSEARYRAVVDTQSEFIARITPDGRLSFVSDAYCRYYGRSRAELLGRPFNEFTLTIPEDRERDATHLSSLALAHPTATIELRRRLPNGSIRWVQWADTAVFDRHGNLAEIQSVGRDVTERVAAEARFLAAAETLPDGLAIFDAEDRLVYHNRRYPEHQMANVRAVLALGIRFEDLLRKALALGPIHHPDMGEGFARSRLAMRRLDQSDHEQHLADGRWVRVREARMPDGGLVLLTSDITHQRALEAELRQAEKLKAVGTLASGIAHDFNNILATIFTSTEVALMQLASDAKARAPLDRVMSAGKHGRQLVAEILTFSRSERTPRVAIDLGAAVAIAIDLCRPTVGDRVDVNLQLPAEPIFVAADDAQIHQIVSNLCLNAAQAMPNGGTVGVRVDSVDGPDGAQRARLRIRDAGSGMDADTASRVFEPFFTTKPVGQGTGLGLAVVHGTVKALGGRVKLGTVPGRGSVFSISLPGIGRAGASALAPTDVFPAGLGRTVLLVEPDHQAAEAVGALLRAAGYRVARFAAPADALQAFSVQRRAELLVSALALPALPGLELARAMRMLAPTLAVVLLADTPASAAEIAAAQVLEATILLKPVLRRELAAAVAAQLAPAPEAPHRVAS